jgi:hypothetical protein
MLIAAGVTCIVITALVEVRSEGITQIRPG